MPVGGQGQTTLSHFSHQLARGFPSVPAWVSDLVGMVFSLVVFNAYFPTVVPEHWDG